MKRRYTPRLDCFAYLGCYRYSLTFCTHRHAPLFRSPAIVSSVLSQISQAAHTERMAVLAYCFMPDHLHLLVAGEHEDTDAEKFIRRAKQLSGYYYKQIYREQLWQRSAWDRVLRV